MKKQQFLDELKQRMQGLPKKDLEDRLSFYEEAIDDRIADGKNEEEAVADLGNIDDIVKEIAQDVPLAKLVKEKVTPKRSLKAWEIVLLVLGFPLWFPLLTVALTLCFVAYMLIWVFVVVAYALETAFAFGSVGSMIAFFIYLGAGEFNLAALGTFLGCAGAAMLFIFPCIGITKGTIALSKKIILGIKAKFIGKGSK